MPDDVQKEREGLEFNALRNALYHTARRNALETWSRWLNFFVILLGASAVADFAKDVPHGVVVLGLAITLIGALQLVFDFAGRARVHELLQRRYYEMLGRLKDTTTPTVEDCARFNGELARISGEEPPTYRALDAIAYNEANSTLYGDARAYHKLRIHWWQSLTRNFIHHNGADFPFVGQQPGQSQ